MFINIITDHDGVKGEMDLNINQMCYLDGVHAQMSNGFTVYVAEESLSEVKDAMYGSAREDDPKVATNVAELLNEIYKLTGGQGDVKVTSDRKARLKTRMKDFSAEELKTAAKNLGEDEFMQGENDRAKRYGTIDWLLKTSANVNKFLEVDPKKPKKNKLF